MPCATLTPDNWDDFGYNTLFALNYVSVKRVVTELGYVKISRDDQPKRTKLDGEFNTLPNNYFSLGQSLSYYENIRKLKKSIREDLLVPQPT